MVCGGLTEACTFCFSHLLLPSIEGQQREQSYHHEHDVVHMLQDIVLGQVCYTSNWGPATTAVLPGFTRLQVHSRQSVPGTMRNNDLVFLCASAAHGKTCPYKLDSHGLLWLASIPNASVFD